ncbi:activating transcription factor 7-interacting protein 1 [Battus philenor]|uniref:activating transcription factor 7-interacting protein 1 n=1 Tax=Battus philenor TaxID=42288 RepID=UPI0035D0E5FF
MQLILDAEATIDIGNNMSAIDQDTLDEKFSSNVIDNFSKDVINNDNQSQDCLGRFEDLKNEPIQDAHIDDQPENNEPTSNAISREDVRHIDVPEENDVNSVDKVNNSLVTSIEEVNEIDLSKSNDLKINEECGSTSQQNGKDLGVRENDEESECNETLESNTKLEPNIDETMTFAIDDIKADNVKTIDLEEIDNEMNINNEHEPPTKIELNNAFNVDKLNKDKEEQIDDSFIIIDAKQEDGKDLEDQKNSSDINSVICDGMSENISKEEISIGDESMESNSVLDTSSNICPDNTELNNIEVCEKDDSIKEVDQINNQISENNTINILDDDGDKEAKKDNEMQMKLESKSTEEKKKFTLVSKLSNTLDILSDDEDEPQEEDPTNIDISNNEKQCISLVDDDDIMLVDEDSEVKKYLVDDTNNADKMFSKDCNAESNSKSLEDVKSMDTKNESDTSMDKENIEGSLNNDVLDQETSASASSSETSMKVKPLLPSHFLKTCKKNLEDMTRDDLEEFCILKIVESVVDRSSLGDIKSQLKAMALTVEEYKKKAMMLTKQNRDLQVVLKSIQEEQKKATVFQIVPLKITRSVGMQVFMTDKPNAKKKNAQTINTSAAPNPLSSPEKLYRNNNDQKPQKNSTKLELQQIPVPRLVPAANNGTKTNTTTQTATNSVKSPQANNLLINCVKSSPPVQKPEKRTRVQSVTVDLTDDEPPSKLPSRGSPAPPVRLVPPQNLLASQKAQYPPNMNSPRKVYIPISGPQALSVRPGQTITLKSVPSIQGSKQRVNNSLAKMQSNAIRMNRVLSNRHPAPLPDAMKQYQPPNWKALPPAPDLKLSKVENGIVISWKIDGYQDDAYEEIISYQLYAYQETTSPPSTALWKKIGDVKALPLPMACTLTQFMAGFKYYFAVRAVDIRSRYGPFSLPGSILLLNKL